MEAYSTFHWCSDCNNRHQIYLAENLPVYFYSYTCPKCGHQNQFSFDELGKIPVCEESIPVNAVVAERITQ